MLPDPPWGPNHAQVRVRALSPDRPDNARLHDSGAGSASGRGSGSSSQSGRDAQLWREEEEFDSAGQHGAGGSEEATGATGGDAIEQVGWR